MHEPSNDERFARVREKLIPLFKTEEELNIWLELPNCAFGYRTPLQVVREGEDHLFDRMIYFLESGQPS